MVYRVTIDTERSTVLEAVDKAAGDLGILWFLCGAYSRVLLCEEAMGTPIGRATNDLDIAICVKSLDEFARFRDVLCRDYMFQTHKNIVHRLIHSSGIWLDIIPFGEFAEPDEVYSWGLDEVFEMNVQGFNNACASSVSILINGRLEVKSAGFAEQFVLKLFAWLDRRSVRGTDDAYDLAYFLRNALGSVSEDDLYGKHDSVLRDTGYDIELASCFALGRRIRAVFSGKTANRVMKILSSELQASDESDLISDMYGSFSSWSLPDERISALIDQVLRGLSLNGD